MGWVPPKLIERPAWMSDEQWLRIRAHCKGMLSKYSVRNAENQRKAVATSVLVVLVIWILSIPLK